MSENWDQLQRRDRIQRLEGGKYREETPGKPVALIMLGAVVLITAVSVSLVVKYSDIIDGKSTALADCTPCHQRLAAYTDYWRKAGASDPRAMAAVVYSVRNPRLMLEVAKLENRCGSQQRLQDQKILADAVRGGNGR